MISLLGMTEDTAAQIKALLPQATITYADWLNRVQNGFKGKPYDPSKTVWQKIVDLLDGVAAPPPVEQWSVEAPRAGAQKVSNYNGIPFLLNGQPNAVVEDKIIDGCSNSCFEWGPECTNVTVRRIHGTRIASIDPYAGYGRHMFYIISENSLLEDIYGQIGGAPIDSLGSIVSYRAPNQILNRIEVPGCKWFGSFFSHPEFTKGGESHMTDGKVTFSNGNDGGMIWDAPWPWHSVFNGFDFVSPGTNILGDLAQAHSLEFNECSFNAKSIAKTNFSGIAPSSFVVR